MSDDTVTRDNPHESRYEIWLDDELAGFTNYAIHGTQADFTHTQVGEAYGGRGLATQLIRAALDDARRRGWSVVPYCQFVRAFIAEHAEYRDLVPAAEHERFGLPS